MASRLTRRVLCAVCVLLLTSAAFAGDGGTWSITKVGASGQVYTWQSGGCWGDPGTWSTFHDGRRLTWKGTWRASTRQVMRGMGLNARMLDEPKAVAQAAKRATAPARSERRAVPAAPKPAARPAAPKAPARAKPAPVVKKTSVVRESSALPPPPTTISNR